MTAELVPSSADSSTTDDPTTSGGATTSDDSGDTGTQTGAAQPGDASGCGCRSTGTPGWGVMLLGLAAISRTPGRCRRRK